LDSKYPEELVFMLRISVHLKLHNTQRENWKAEGKNCCGRWKAAISHFIL